MNTKVTLSKFNAAKILFKGGATAQEVAEYLDISRPTASRIKNADTLEEYNQNAKAAYLYCQNQKKKQQEASEEKPAVQPQSVTIVANHFMAEELRKQTELLTTISAKLAFIVDELTK